LRRLLLNPTATMATPPNAPNVASQSSLQYQRSDFNPPNIIPLLSSLSAAIRSSLDPSLLPSERAEIERNLLSYRDNVRKEGDTVSRSTSFHRYH